MQTDFTKAPEFVEATELVTRTEMATTGFKITTPAEYQDSAGTLKRIMAGKKRLEELRTTITGPLNAALKAVNELFREPAARLEKVERSIKAEISRYADEQERIRQEEQRKADERARQEREKQEAAERKAREEADQKRRDAEAARAAGDTTTAAKLEQQAERREEKADTAAMAAASVVAPIIHREPPKVAGIASREVWKAEVDDLHALVKAIAEGKAPLALVQANNTVIGQQARSLKSDFKVPGIRVWSERSIAAGAA